MAINKSNQIILRFNVKNKRIKEVRTCVEIFKYTSYCEVTVYEIYS
jgi:hypothetical protein